MRLLDTTGRLGRALAGLLGGELLARGLASGGLAGGLLLTDVVFGQFPYLEGRDLCGSVAAGAAHRMMWTNRVMWCACM